MTSSSKMQASTIKKEHLQWLWHVVITTQPMLSALLCLFLWFSRNQPASFTDSRTENWLLMSSPLPQTIIIAAYIYFVTSLGPRIMENRKAFDLKGVLIIYNFGVVALSLYMCYEVSHTSALAHIWHFCAAPVFLVLLSSFVSEWVSVTPQVVLWNGRLQRIPLLASA